jgi:hypothetical protein
VKSSRLASFVVLTATIGCTATLDLAELQEGCPEGEKACNDTCVPSDDPSVGCAEPGCDPCPGDEERLACDADGACTLSACPSGQKECDGECVSTDDSAFGCAATGCRPCEVANGTAGCDDDGACVADTCRDDYKVCDGACVSTSNPLYGCGRTRCDPCILPSATPSCGIDGDCAVGACIGRRGDCNREPDDGCEANLNEDVDNCGQCGAACAPLPHAEVTCGGANCVVRFCDIGWGNCDGLQSTGCETDILTSSDHCGGCAKPCAVEQTCVDGTCE